MKVSINTIRAANARYASAGDPAPNGVDALVQKIGSSLGAVDEIAHVGKKYESAVIVRVVSVEHHPNADRLHVCMVDDAGVVQDVERDERGYVQVVCGAPNVHAGMLAVWLPPGSTVPSTYDSHEPFVLDTRKFRGVVSRGMLASPKELALGDDHGGILEITDHPDEHKQPTPGTWFADAYNLRDDVVLDLENKMFTHRPDCFGFLGVAREIAGINHSTYVSPEWYRYDVAVSDPEGQELPLTVANEIPAVVPRLTAIVLRDVEVKPSPVWLRVELAKLGVRSINNIVDYTNFFMLETGQPLHAYDYDKVRRLSGSTGPVLSARYPREGESLTLLNGKTVTPSSTTPVIATDTTLLGIAGIMGGSDSEVDETTKHIIIECASFDMYAVRRASMALGLFSDAATRFTKGQSPLQTRTVLAKIVDEIRAFASGKVASRLYDDNHLPEEVQARGYLHDAVEVGRSFINERLGLALSTDTMQQLLTNVEFDVSVQADVLAVKAPFWRTDVAIAEDIVEEIGRLYGYEHLPLQLPKRGIQPPSPDAVLRMSAHIRQLLASRGANELLTYSFVHGNLLDTVGQDRDQAFRLANALSPDLQYYRLSLTPGLLEKIRPNVKAGHSEFALFEIGKANIKGLVNDDGTPKEFERLALVFAVDGKHKRTYQGAPYYQARKYLVELLASLGLASKLTFEPIDFTSGDQAIPYYQPGRSATVKIEGRTVGRIGEYRAEVRKRLKLPDFCAGFELGLDALVGQSRSPYVALSRFPKVEQDICLRVPVDLPYQTLLDTVWSHLSEHRPDHTYHDVSPVDIYQRDNDAKHKQITFRVHIASYERTLTDQEVNALLERVAEAARQAFDAERV